MHSPSTRTEFLRLRIQGLSLSSIARRLGVSKPTLIAWNRQAQPEIQSAILNDQQLRDSELASTANQQLADLNRKLTALKQELFSRALRDIPTPDIETLAGEIRQKIQHLESLKSPAPHEPPAASPIQNQNSKIENDIVPNRT